MTPLIVGFFLVLATLTAVVVDASAAYLRRQNMDALADSAALAATDGLQGDEVYTHGLDRKAVIDPVAADHYVEDYLARAGARSTYPGLTVRVVTQDNTVRVRLASPLRLPLRVPGVDPNPSVVGDAASEVLVGQ